MRSGETKLSASNRARALWKPSLAQNGAATVGYLASFMTARLATYLVPLILAALAPPQVYGGIEVAYAISLLIVTVAVSAPLHGFSHLSLIGEERAVNDQAAAIVLASCVLAGLGFAAAALLDVTSYPMLTVAVAGVSATQIVMSFLLRIGRRTWILPWIDGLVLLFGLLAVTAIVGLRGRVETSMVSDVFATLTVCLGLLAAAWLHRRPVARLTARLAASTRVGTTMAAFALFSTWIAVSGRIMIGFIAPDDLAAYGVAFRIAAVGLGMPQLVLTAFWTTIYIAPTRSVDRLLAWFLAGTALVLALVCLFGRILIREVEFEAMDAHAVLLSQELLPPVALQIFFWSGHVMLQPRINRCGVAGRSIAPLTVLTVAGGALILASSWLGAAIVGTVWLLALYSAAYFFTSWILLARRGLPHTATLRVAICAGAGLALLVLV